MRDDDDPRGVLTFEFAAHLRRETEKAYLLDDGTRQAWFPKKLCEDNGNGTFTCPEWLAIDKGFA